MILRREDFEGRGGAFCAVGYVLSFRGLLNYVLVVGSTSINLSYEPLSQGGRRGEGAA